MRRNRPDFDKRLKLLSAQIEAFNIAIQKKLGTKLTEAVQALARTLLPPIRARLPQRYRRVLPVSRARALLPRTLANVARRRRGTGEQYGESHPRRTEARRPDLLGGPAGLRTRTEADEGARASRIASVRCDSR